jgi:tetratricopeptide (TPR) repeat protein
VTAVEDSSVVEASPGIGRRSFFSRAASLAGGAGAVLVFGSRLPAAAADAGPEQPPFAAANGDALDPDVVRIMSGTFLAHAMGTPDAEETADALEGYLRGYAEIVGGRLDEAVARFDELAVAYPTFRHVRHGQGLARLQRWRAGGDGRDLEQAADDLEAAVAAGVRNGVARGFEELFDALRSLGQVERARRSYDALATTGDQAFWVTACFGELLVELDDESGLDLLEHAHAGRPQGNVRALEAAGRYLVRHNRGDEWVARRSDPAVLGEREDIPFFGILDGVVHERAGRTAEASKAYARAADFSQFVPIDPAILGGKVELARRAGVRFVGDESPGYRAAFTYSDCLSSVVGALGRLVSNEAGAETAGGQRAVAYTVRTRALKGNAGASCLSVDNSGSSRDEKYCHVMTQSSQFAAGGTTSAPTGPTTQAYYVFTGAAPDPVSGLCPAGTKSGTNCDGSCSVSDFDTAWGSAPRAFYHPSSEVCASIDPNASPCMAYPVKACANSAPNNCFYRSTT